MALTIKSQGAQISQAVREEDDATSTSIFIASTDTDWDVSNFSSEWETTKSSKLSQ